MIDPACAHRVAGRWLVAIVAVAAVLLVACGGGDEGDDDEDRPVSAPPRIAVEGDETLITLDPATLARSGIVVGSLAATSYQAEITAYGAVLDLAGLAEARGAQAAAATRLAKAKAALVAAQAEYERTRSLLEQGAAASQKTFEATTAALQTAEAEARGAEAAQTAQTAAAGQRWGAVIAGWVASGSPHLDALLRQDERLVQVTVPPGIALGPPPATAVLRAEGASVVAHLVSPAPRTDLRIQGESLLYVAPATSSLLPGASVAAQLPAGVSSTGVVVPTAAVVWWRGKAWVYVEKSPGTFVRREVPVDAPLSDGWFARGGLTASERIVVQGSQTLLSEEGRAAVHGSEG